MLYGIRKPRAPKSRARDIAASLLFLLLGAAVGILAKWLDGRDLGASRLLAALDPGNLLSGLPVFFLIALAISVFSRSALKAALNVFAFFMGMCVCYHLYSALISGFDPRSYMLTWYGFALLSPLFAAVCWYAKGENAVSIIMDCLILGVMAAFCFALGFWYFGFRSAAEAVIFPLSAAVLYKSPKQCAISLIAGLALGYVFSAVLPVG
ncbi:MAG: hypothetical protein K6G56_05150 [Clostridiales bacterium]|nr:hypothetical protein [Clostridiales bacterium]